MELTPDQKFELITRNLQEAVIDETIVKKIMEKRPLKIYWGTAPTGRIHIGYFVPILKIIDYLRADCEVTILIADLHATLDSMKSTFDQVDSRTQYYTRMIREILKSVNVDLSKLKFVKGTDFQLSQKYTLDVYKAHTLVSVSEAKHSGAEVVKQSSNPKMTGLMYPTLQALDEEYLGSDAQFGGIDQRKIFMHARKVLPLLGYKKRFHLMSQMVPGLRFAKKDQTVINAQNTTLKDQLLNTINSETDEQVLAEKIKSILETEPLADIQIDKMSSSNNDSKIDLLDTPNQIKSKINKAYCLPADTEDNCLMTILDKILFPVLKLKGLDFVINRTESNGGPIIYTKMLDIQNDFANQKLHPADFKSGITDSLNIILSPIRQAFREKELTKLVNKAYLPK